MKLYYHMTDGGAEYYTLEEDDLTTTVLRTDGNEIEVFMDNLNEANIKLIVHGGKK